METRWKTSGSTGSIGSIESMCSMAPGGDGAGLPPAAERLRMDIRCSRAEGEGGPSESQPSRRRQYGVFAPRFCAVGPGEIQRSWSHVPQTERNFLVERHQTRPRPILPKRWQVRLCPGGSASLPASTEAESLYVLELEVFIGTVVARQLHGLERLERHLMIGLFPSIWSLFIHMFFVSCSHPVPPGSHYQRRLPQHPTNKERGEQLRWRPTGVIGHVPLQLGNGKCPMNLFFFFFEISWWFMIHMMLWSTDMDGFPMKISKDEDWPWWTQAKCLADVESADSSERHLFLHVSLGLSLGFS